MVRIANTRRSRSRRAKAECTLTMARGMQIRERHEMTGRNIGSENSIGPSRAMTCSTAIIPTASSMLVQNTVET